MDRIFPNKIWRKPVSTLLTTSKEVTPQNQKPSCQSRKPLLERLEMPPVMQPLTLEERISTCSTASNQNWEEPESMDEHPVKLPSQTTTKTLLERMNLNQTSSEGNLLENNSGHKLDFSCLEYATKNDIAPNISANLKRTNEVLESWSQDPKEARRRLMYHPCSPEFHESGWSEIVTGKCVNLDTVHTCLITAQTVDKQTETIGGIEIKYGTTEVSAKKITTYQEWTTAWHRASEAIRFVFPHRQNELNTYYRTILQKFDQTADVHHGRVIWFDKAVRNRVASSRRYELCDSDAFRDIYDAIFLPSGKQYYPQSDPKPGLGVGRSGGSDKRDPCLNWNNGKCTRSGSTCRYAHVCAYKLSDGQWCRRSHTEAKHGSESKPGPSRGSA